MFCATRISLSNFSFSIVVFFRFLMDSIIRCCIYINEFRSSRSSSLSFVSGMGTLKLPSAIVRVTVANCRNGLNTCLIMRIMIQKSRSRQMKHPIRIRSLMLDMELYTSLNGQSVTNDQLVWGKRLK